MKEMIPGLVEIGIAFSISILGAICRDYYNTITNKDQKIQIPRILLSAITGTIIIYGLNIRVKVGNRYFIILCYSAGILGLDLFGKIKNIDIDKIIEILKRLKG